MTYLMKESSKPVDDILVSADLFKQFPIFLNPKKHKKQMSKFANNITVGGNAVKSKRADLIAQQAEQKQTQLIQSLKARITDKKMALENLNDLNPESEDSLRPGAGFNADQWVNQNFSIQKDLILLQIDLKIAEDTYAEWFSAGE